ncbi:hypothetical protein [Neisseria lactamica]|uniref:hypothetical protein n=1 Tax=Neisseria lactamica TaxID=486 RepID=UPI0011454380|nr:hypothetical protein [Neisseria lactamica]
MKAHTFSSIIEEIKEANSLTDTQRARLLSLVSYIQSTKLELLRNITPKRIAEITQEYDKNVIVDIFFFYVVHNGIC